MTAPTPAAFDDRRRALAALLLEQRQRAGGRLGPASFAQQRLWIVDRLVPSSAEYNVAIALRVSSELDVAALRSAIRAVVSRHESLRTVFRAAAEVPMQKVQPAADLTLEMRDVSGDPQPEQAALVLARELAAVPFDLAVGPLLRPALIRISAADHLLVLVTHHIVCDGWSAGILCRDLDRFYARYRDGEPVDATPLPFQYIEYAVFERRQLSGAVLERQVAYWRRELSGVPGLLRLPTDRPRPASRQVRGASHLVELPEELLGRLRQLAASEGTTVFAALLAGFHALLARYTGQVDLNVGVPAAGRTTSQVSDLVGFFVNTLVLRGRLGGAPTFRELVARTRRTITDAFTNQDVPFERLVAELRPDRDNSVSPFFQVVFNYQAVESDRVTLPGLGARIMPLDNGTVRFDVEVNLFGQGDSVSGAWNYNAELFDADTIAQMATHYQRLLTAAVTEPDRPMRELPLVTDAATAQTGAATAQTGAATAQTGAARRSLGAYERFQLAATTAAGATALTAGSRRWTYRDLLSAVDAFAARLASVTAGGEGPLCLYLPRSPELVAAQLAALRERVAYLVVDPAAVPAGQLTEALAMVGASAIVIGPGPQPAVAGFTGRFLRAADCASPQEATAPQPASMATAAQSVSAASAPPSGCTPRLAPEPADPAAVAYLRFDAESIDPVAVAVSHRALAARLAWLSDRYPLDPGAIVLHHGPCDGDPVRDLLWPLGAAAHVVLTDADTVADPAPLADQARTHGIEVLTATPSQLAGFLADPRTAGCHRLRLVLCGGEPLGTWLARRFAEVLPHAALHAHWSSMAIGDALALGPAPRGRLGLVAVGHPAAGASARILDDAGLQVPRGVVGRLHIGGAQLPAGWPGRPDEGARRTVPDPVGGPGESLLDTGDLARVGPDGAVEVLGAQDTVGDIRGVRVEAPEIEEVLAGAPGVVAAVVVFDDFGSGPRVHAYIVPACADTGSTDTGSTDTGSTDTGGGAAAAGHERLLSDIGTHARRLLPREVVPHTLTLVDHLPLRRDGTLDRDALPVIAPLATGGAIVRPLSQVEQRVAAVWRDVLGRDDIGPDDDFFHSGGHSLLAIGVTDRLRRVLGVDLPVSVLFRYRTIGDLAERLTELGAGREIGAGTTASCLVRIQTGTASPALALAHPAGGTVFCYAGLASALPDRTLDAFEAQTPGSDLPAMAARYVAELIQAGRPAPVFGGWSLGGVVAFEMARQYGHQTGLLRPVVLVDSYLPGSADPRLAGNGRSSAADDERLVTAFLADLCAEAGAPPPTRQFDDVVAGLSALRADGILPDLEVAGVEARFQVYRANMVALARYRPDRYAGPVHLVRAADLPSPEQSWRALCQLEAVHSLPGDHHGVLRGANLPVLARILEGVLRAAASPPPSEGRPAC